MIENLIRAWVADEKNIRIMFFVSVFLLMALWEWKASRRNQKIPKTHRWPNNLAMTLLNTLVVRILFPGSALWASYLAASYRIGFFNWVEVPFGVSAVLTISNLDWVIYYQHRAFHALPWLWKIHRVHHTDLEVDVTTGMRFHPLEAVLSMCVKSLAIVALGAPPGAVFLFELILNTASLFNHANIRMPRILANILKLFIVTPDMHRIHHSVIPREFGSNFGFIFSWWDRLFGTYRAEPEKGQEEMTLGLGIFNDLKYLKGDQMLMQPFMDKEGRFDLAHFIRPD